MSFEPLPSRESAVDLCMRAISDAILSGELIPGSRLPPERVLAEELKVNRTTLRNALKCLSARGLLRVRQGSGYAVEDFRTSGGADLLIDLCREIHDVDEAVVYATDLLRVRRHLAGSVLETLVKRQSPVDQGPIRTSIAHFSALAMSGGSKEDLAAADLAVFSAIVEASGSVVLSLCVHPVARVLAGFEALRAALYTYPSESVLAYQALLAWLTSPTAEGQALIMGEMAKHDERTIERVREICVSEESGK